MDGKLASGLRGATVAALFAMASAATAAELGVLPVTESVGGYRGNELAYINGGISRDEADALRNAAPNFPLQLVFTRQGEAGAGEFVADAALEIYDQSGNRVAALDNQGPIFLARVPDGRYVIVAERDGKRQTRKVEVRSDRNRTVNFAWK